MSRSYDWTWEINGIAISEAVAVNGVLDDYLDRDSKFDRYDPDSKTLTGSSSRSLGGGESPDERADTVFNAIKGKLNRVVPVEITVIFIEQCPTETFSYGEHTVEVAKVCPENEEEQ